MGVTESNSVMGPGGRGRVVALDHADPEVTAAIWAVMQDAYRVEATILSVADFVPLRRTVTDIAATDARFRGIHVDGELAAVIETVDEGASVKIDALVVRPSRFRQGLATALLRDVFDADPSRTLTVSTAVANEPGVELYRAHGFRETDRWATPDGIPMVTLVRESDGVGSPRSADTE